MKQIISLLLMCAVVVIVVINWLGFTSKYPAVAATASENKNYLPEIAPVGATLLDGLGSYSLPVTSANTEVQRWFDQGMILTYGFNHQAAERSFLKALELDPQCAMCWWGAALVLGPHVNAAMDPASNAAAWQRLQAARSMAHLATPWEQAFIKALSARYAEQPGADRTALDKAYAEAMAEVMQTLPQQLDAATLYAEAMMNLQPWDYWDDHGQPVGNTRQIVQILESVLARNAEHAGALHLYIHAVEASNEPEKGVVAADRLRTLIPGSGHLVHMPAHIYARVGRWQDAVIANQLAIEADNSYLAACRPTPGVYPLGYVPHNHHFLWFAATMTGNSKVALAAADSTYERTSDPQLMRLPGMEAMQNFAMTPLFARVRFGQWHAIQQMAKPAAEFPYMIALWHYGQGLAALRLEQPEAAKSHHSALSELTQSAQIAKMMVWDRYALSYSVQLAERMLAAEIDWQYGRREQAFSALTQALAIEDKLPYDEPPAWHAPVRHTYGAMLLNAGHANEAEKVYQDELKRNPENGWSLFGLMQSFKAQNKLAEATETEIRFRHAWANADISLTSSRL